MDRNKIEIALMNAVTNVTVIANLLSKCQFYTYSIECKESGDKWAGQAQKIGERLAAIRKANSSVGLQRHADLYTDALEGKVWRLNNIIACIGNYRDLHSGDATTFAIRGQLLVLLNVAVSNIECVIDELDTLA